MKKILAAVFAVMIGLVFSTATLTQATPGTPVAKAAGVLKKEQGKKNKGKGEKKHKKPKKKKKQTKK